ncbi:hypothetical protein [Flavobacterium sp.]|uniref:hypothetical protein n=1 Tax=Flavobacterium sp. TaxID=239 RepID=UPI003751CCF8
MPNPVKKIMVKVKRPLNETASRKDSLDTHKSSSERNDFYRKAGYTEDAPKLFDKTKQNQSDIDELAYKSVDYKKDKPTTNIIRNGVTTKEALNPNDYAKKVDKHKYDQRDNVTQDVNMDAPMGRKDSRMQPTETITFRKGTDIASVDQYQKPSEKKKVMVKVKRKITTNKPVAKNNSNEKEESEILKKGSYLSNS